MKLSKQAKWSFFILSAVCILLGLCFVLFPEGSAMLFGVLFGVLMVVWGLLKIVFYFRGEYFGFPLPGELTFGVLDVVLGGILLARPGVGASIFPFILGFVLVADSLIKFQMAFDAKRSGLSSWWIVLLTAVVGVVFGVLLVINPFEGAAFLMIFYGIALMVDGIENFIAYACVKKHIKESYPVESWFIDNDNNNFLS